MIVWFLTGNVMANPISVDDAMLRAKKFVSSNTARRIKGNINLSLAYSMTDSLSTLEETVLYAFNINDGNGFVIVAGDDVAKPILGYCDSGSFDADNIPVNMKAWLNSYAEEISWAKKHDSTTTTTKTVHTGPRKAKSSIEALLTTKWGQEGPYNYQCCFNGVECATGCVATAMAQILYYWATKGANGEKYPCGSEPIESYTTLSKHYEVGALDKLESFDWSNMTMRDGYPSTTASKNAVSQLMRYCGQSVKMDYGPSGSGADTRDVIPALRDIFGFSTNMTCEFITYVESINQEALNWNDMIYNQLIDGKPVFIACSSHAFICDGYDDNTGKFHFNWGWEGSFDGWYEMNSSNVYTVNLKYAKEAIINIQPEKRKQYAVLSADRSTLTFYYDCDKDSREGTVYDIREDFDTQYWWQTPTKRQGWYGIKTITDVVFDESFGKALPKNTSHWFEELRGLVNISNLELLNTSYVTDMSCMFAGCNELPFLDLRPLDTSNVTDMSGMFKNCLKLETILIGDDYWHEGFYIKSSFNTANVTNMRGMFLECQSLRYVNISYLNTDKVTNMSNMFSGCLKLPLKELGVEGLYTHNVTNMSGMFAGCFLPDYNDYEYWYDFPTVDLDLSFFDTSNVTDMSYMFAYCDLLSSINMCSFNTSKVSNMSGMFSYCNYLYELNVSNFDTSNVTDMGNMFSSCIRLSNLDVSNFITSKVSNMSDMFSYCSGITELDVSNFETSKVTNMSRLFSGCSGLSELNVSSFDMSKAQSSSNIFTNCKKLNTLYIPASISALSNSDFCNGVGTESNPCTIYAPDDFDFGVDVSGDYFQWKKGYFTLGKIFIFGDVNHDNEVNIIDVVLTVDYVLGKENSNFYYENADVNSDEVIDILDVVGIVNIVLGNSSAYNTPKKSYLKAIDNIYVSQNYDGIDVGLDDSNQYIACQFTVKLPEGCFLKEVTLDEDCSNGHSLKWNYLGNRTYKVLVFSLDGKTFVNNDTFLFNMSINGRDNERIEISDIVFVNQAYEGVVYDDVHGVPTSIVDVSNENDDVPLYNLQGMKVANPSTKGLYIRNGKKVSIMR